MADHESTDVQSLFQRRMMLDMVVAGDLSDAERRVWDAFPTGRLVKFGTGNAEDDDPARGEGWGPNRQVRAEVLAALLCGALEVEPGQAGQVRLERARVTGKLELPDVAFKHRLQLTECCVADGIDLSGATIGKLDLSGCHIGAVRLDSAKVDGAFVLKGAHLNGQDGPVLMAQGLIVTGNMFCDEGFQSDGEVSLYGASIGGVLALSGAHLNGKDGGALTAPGLIVTGSMFCDEGFQAEGMVSLNGASIGGELNFGGAHLNGKDGPALSAGGLTVTGNMLCIEGFQAEGMVSLFGASIGGELNFGGAHLNGKDGPALMAQGLTVTGSMFCIEGFQAEGMVSLVSASIGGALVIDDARLNGKDGHALIARALTVTADMFCGFQADGKVGLDGATVGSINDLREFWPQHLLLDGLTYGNLTYMPARERLDWLNRSGSYSPQPYEQLAGYYRRLGHDEQARCVLLAKQRQRRRQHSWWARWWGWLQDGLAGYGYAPGRALLLLAGAFVAGWVVFSNRHPVPVGPGPHPAFNAALYTLDVLIPAPVLGQASDFVPQGTGLAVAAGLHIFGWLLAITVIGTITRSFSKN